MSGSGIAFLGAGSALRRIHSIRVGNAEFSKYFALQPFHAVRFARIFVIVAEQVKRTVHR
jgi:hypothetical protein